MKNSKINRKDITGRTPLHNACKWNKRAIVKYLVEHGANINTRDNDNNTPLMIACMQGNEDIVKYLVEHGAIVDTIALNLARRMNNENILEFLREHVEKVTLERELIIECINREGFLPFTF